jgi:hypothetical protein
LNNVLISIRYILGTEYITDSLSGCPETKINEQELVKNSQ